MQLPASAKGFKRFWDNKINRILLILIIIFISATGVLYSLASSRAEASLVEQMLHREQVIGRAGARSIEVFLEFSGDSLATLATDSFVSMMDDRAQTVLDNFIDKRKETPLVEVILVDEEGEVVFVANQEMTGMRAGTSVADRDYFIASKEANAGEVFAGEPLLPRLGAFEGQYLIPLATPVFEDGEFKGVLGAGVLLSELAEIYLDPLKISDQTRVYLINTDGVVLHSPYRKFIGVNWFDYMKERPYQGSQEVEEKLRVALAAPKEGKLDIYLINERTGKPHRFLIAYAPILTNGDQYWILGIASPIEEALLFFTPFHQNQIIALVFVLLVLLSFSGLFVLAIRLAQRDAYQDGFATGKKSKTKK